MQSHQGVSDPAKPFIPPCCPRSSCRYHHCAAGWRWQRHGSYPRLCAPQRIPRFRCVHCRVTFSSQTFSTTYYLKRPALLVPFAHRLLTCAGYRQIAREARCHPTTVMGQAARLGRHALLYLYAHRPRGPVREPLVIDGFESFAYSQYHPLYLNLVVGSPSHYAYGFTFAALRRHGRMRADQKRRRAALEARYGRPDPRAIQHTMAEALTLAVPEPQALTVHSDEHQDYPRALRQLPHGFDHRRTSSLAARTAGNPLFPVNRLDLLLRHNSANLKRETIAFSKRHQSVVERAALLLLWQNFVKPFSERRGGGTPAMRLGLRTRPETLGGILKERLFPSRVQLPEPWAGYYRREIPTPGIIHPRRHELRRAC